MSICSKCGTQFNAKFCPNCGTPAEQATNQTPPQYQQPVYQQPIYQPPVYPQKKKMKWWQILLIVFGALVVLGIISNLISGGDTESDPSSTGSGATVVTAATTATTIATTTATTEAKTSFGINDPAAFKDVQLTVTKIEKSSGSEYIKPKEGMEYVIVTVKYKNIGTKDTISYNPYDFKMLNSKGQITDHTYTTVNSDTALSSGDLAPSGEIEGTIAFEQPSNDTALVLQYTSNMFLTDSKIDFKLN